eukprot:3517051-Pyramimonas_sp.AAC.1
MFGGDKRAAGPVHTKAAETGPLLRWSVDLLFQFEVAAADYLRPAGQALVKHLRIMKEQPAIMPRAATRELLFTFREHVRLLQLCGGKFLPKHHLWAHLVLRCKENGNP